MAMASSSLNPNAPMFIPAAFRRVEDFSPEWWELVKTTAWFRDHWFHQHQLHEEFFAFADDADVDVAALLPDDSVDLLDMVDTDDLFYTPDQPDLHHHLKPAGFGGDVDAVLKTLSLNSPRGGGAAAARAPREQPRHGEKLAQYVGAKAGARRVIHQPR